MSVSQYANWGKRCFDIGFAGIALVLTLPVILCVAGAVLITLGRPVFYRQERTGRNERCFMVIKFRTMDTAFDFDGTPLPDKDRLSTFGSFLRSTSMDELPELWNVLRGDMSLVGPRPLPTRYLPRYSLHERRRFELRPGITGWAQVNGRNSLTWDQKFACDIWYVENVSLRLDLFIVLRTFRSVLSRQGISTNDHATSPEFRPLE